MSETWKRVPGYGGRYWASSKGRIWSESKKRILSQSTAGQMGYKRIGIPTESGGSTSGYVHRLVALAFHGKPKPEQAEVRHLDGDHLNNDPANLAWGTSAENAADMIRHGRTAAFDAHCPNGHERGPESTGWNPVRGGFRVCLICSAATRRRLRTGGICPPGHRHEETLTCANNHGCKCAPCREAIRKYRKDRGWK